jgi:RNA polymerase sigma factor (sigma-70 family)
LKNKSSNDLDVSLISRIKEGDTAAFKILVEKYKDVSLSLANSIIKDETKAEDILQDVFIKVFDEIYRFKFKSSFSTWLYRIVVNMSYNALRKEKEKTKINIYDNEYDEIIDTENTGIDNVNETDQKKYIVLAIERLRPDEALVLRLFYLCELSIAEIQEITNFKPTKIKVDLHRGRANLYFHLKQILGDEINHLL